MRYQSCSSFKITDQSFRYASPHLWNQLPHSLHQPRPDLPLPDSSVLYNNLTSPVSSSPLLPSITPSFFFPISKRFSCSNPTLRRHLAHSGLTSLTVGLLPFGLFCACGLSFSLSFTMVLICLHIMSSHGLLVKWQSVMLWKMIASQPVWCQQEQPARHHHYAVPASTGASAASLSIHHLHHSIAHQYLQKIIHFHSLQQRDG